MPVETVLTLVLLAAVLLNSVLVGLFVRRARSRGGGRDEAGPGLGLRRELAEPWREAPGPQRPPDPAPDPLPAGESTAAAEPPDAGAGRSPTVLSPDDVDAAMLGEPFVLSSPRTGEQGRAPALGRRPRAASVSPAPGEPDSVTGLHGREAWESLIAGERRRFARYGRPTSVVLAEIVGMRAFGEQLGERQAERVLAAVADTFRRECRSCDHVARVGWSRFGILLPETDEEQAANYVERVRASCERWLETADAPLRLSIGVASPDPSAGLDSALNLAEQRIDADAGPAR